MARPAKTTSAAPSLATLIHFFVSGPLAEVRAAIETGKAIVASRTGTTNGASTTAPRKRVRKPKPAADGAVTAAPAAAGPVAVPEAGKRGPGRPRGPRAARPAVTAADAAPATAVPGAVVEAAGAAPLPDQGVPEGE